MLVLRKAVSLSGFWARGSPTPPHWGHHSWTGDYRVAADTETSRWLGSKLMGMKISGETELPLSSQQPLRHGPNCVLSNLVDTSISDFQPPEPREHKFLLFLISDLWLEVKRFYKL